ncbi:hypothetical protein Tco_1328575 [Tanacetum coccineum]
MDDPTSLWKNNIRLQEEKLEDKVELLDWQNARYQVDGYDEGIIHSYEQRLETIWGRLVNRVYVLDFAGLTDGMRQTLGDRLSMVYVRDDEKALFTSHAWRRLFEVMVLLVREFILEFLSTYRMSDTKMGLDVADILCFSSKPGFGAYWFSVLEIRSPYKGDLCITGWRYQLNRPSWARSFLWLHHYSTNKEANPHGWKGLRGLLVVVSKLSIIDLHELARFNICSRFGDTWAWIAPGLETQQAAAVGAPRAVEDALAANEGAQAIPAPVQAPQLPPPPP